MSNFNAFWITVGKFYAANKDIINTLFSGTLPVIIPAGIGLIWWYRQQRRKRQLPVPSSPFECIPPRSEVLQRIYSGDKDNPLADFNIPYQSRQINRNIRQELERELEKTGWLLILGRTGIGKTREAAELVQLLNHEGWTVLRLKVGEWVDVPTQEQLSEIGTNRHLLFFLDNLNQRISYSIKDEISLKAKDCALAPLYVPLQERLLKTLEAYEEFCGKTEVRVIATARNESQPTEPGKPSELEKLQFEKYPKLWQRFTMYELPEPSDEAVVRLLTDVVPLTHLHAKEENYSGIAKRNDSTFRNVVENLVRLENRQLPLTPENYRDTLQATWQGRYQDAVKRYSISPYIYDAIELLRLCGLPLERVLIQSTALLLSKGSFWQRWLYRWKIYQALNYLIEAENILNPRDGQIEGKGKPVDVEKYILPLIRLVLKLAERYPWTLFDFLGGFGVKLVVKLNHPKAALAVFDRILEFYQVIAKRSLKTALAISGNHSQSPYIIDDDAQLALQLKQKLDSIWLCRGYALSKLGRTEEAVADYDKALEIKPDSHEAWFFRGIALTTLGRTEEAVADYDKALEIKPDFHKAWYLRGVDLYDLGRTEEAIACFEKTLEIKPDYHEAWYFRGLALTTLGRTEEAIADYDKTLEIKPDYHEAWYLRGFALGKLGRTEEAIASYDKALEIKPDYHEAWYLRGVALYDLGRTEEAIADYDKALEIKPDYHEAWNTRGLALYDLGRTEEAIADYDKALEIKPDYHEAWNNRGIALVKLGRTEEAFASWDKAVEIKPDLHEAWNNRGIALVKLGRTEEAFADYDKALEIKPDYHEAWYLQGIALINLGRTEEAFACFEKALEIKLDYHKAWFFRGNALDDLGRYEEAIASYDKALEIKPDDHEAWNNRGIALDHLGCYEEGIASYDKALEIKPDDHEVWYNKAGCYALQGNTDLALENLQQAIHLNPDKYRQLAETDSDFESIRQDSRFQMLIQGRSGEK